MKILKVQKAIRLKDGEHVGKITKIRHRSREFNYVDIEITTFMDKKPIKLIAGFPEFITEFSRLGKLLRRFGINLYVGKEINIKKELFDVAVKFTTYTQKSKKGEFAKILEDTIRPANILEDF